MKEDKTAKVLVKLPTSKLNAIKRKQGNKRISDSAYILLAIDSYLNPINEEYYI